MVENIAEALLEGSICLGCLQSFEDNYIHGHPAFCESCSNKLKELKKKVYYKAIKKVSNEPK